MRRLGVDVFRRVVVRQRAPLARDRGDAVPLEAIVAREDLAAAVALDAEIRARRPGPSATNASVRRAELRARWARREARQEHPSRLRR